ncbi:MAG: CbtA family protein [Rhizobiales bacterium]|nr:CbtA family protein [Hyphomicrobiales bacterium]
MRRTIRATPPASPATEQTGFNIVIGRVLLAAILAGIAAGLVMGVIQHVRLTPLIIQAETFEAAEAPAVAADPSAAAANMPAGQTHDHGATPGTAPAGAEHHHDPEAWAPQDGLERTFYTTLTAMLAGAGFALLLVGVSFGAGIPITRDNGLIWGLCGFIAVSLAPAFSLPPELPGTAAASLPARQAWWLATIAATAIAIWLAATRRSPVMLLAAALLVVLPHAIGAPQVPPVDTPLPAAVQGEFVAASLGASFVLWLLIGFFLSITLNPAREKSA